MNVTAIESSFTRDDTKGVGVGNGSRLELISSIKEIHLKVRLLVEKEEGSYEVFSICHDFRLSVLC